MAGCYHALLGSVIIMRRLAWVNRSALSRKSTKFLLLLVFAVIGVLALLSFGGVLYDIPNPADNDYARAYANLLGFKL